jgi:hypothetical protein
MPVLHQDRLDGCFFAVLGLFFGGILVASIGMYWSTMRLSAIASDFTPSWTETIQSNSTNQSYVERAPKIPPKLTWYTATHNDRKEDPTGPTPNHRPTHYLFYRSTLHPHKDSWSGFFLWRSWLLPKFSLLGKSHLIVLLEAQDSADILEVGLKDFHGKEIKMHLLVVRGWAGYRIPLEEFGPIDMDRIQLFLLAHSRGAKSTDANTFRIALIGAI